MLWDHSCIAQSSSIDRSNQGNHCLARGLLFCDVTSHTVKRRVTVPARRLHPSLALCPLQQQISSCEFYVTASPGIIQTLSSSSMLIPGFENMFLLSRPGRRKFILSPQCKIKSLRSSLQHFHLCYIPRESSPLSSLQSRIYFWEPSSCCPSP